MKKIIKRQTVSVMMLMLFCLLMTGCSRQFFYHHIDWFVIEYIDDYVDLTDAQEDLIRQQVNAFSHWFEQDEVSQYISHLDELIALNPKTFDIAMLRAQKQKIEMHTQRILAQLSPDLVTLAAGLSDGQVHQLISALRDRHTEYRKKFQG